jgi:hypothetical protein
MQPQQIDERGQRDRTILRWLGRKGAHRQSGDLQIIVYGLLR